MNSVSYLGESQLCRTDIFLVTWALNFNWSPGASPEFLCRRSILYERFVLTKECLIDFKQELWRFMKICIKIIIIFDFKWGVS